MGPATARPLLWWTQGQLDALAATLAAPWAAWLRDWQGQGSAAGSVECVLAQDTPTGSAAWSALGSAGEALAWAEVPQRTGAPAASLAAALDKKAWDALLVELALALGLQRQTVGEGPPASGLGLWSGGVAVRFFAPTASLRLLLNGGCALKALGNRTAEPIAARLPPVADGISALPARAAVELAACEIDVGDLQAVKVGDVLRLPHALDEPMRVTIGRRPVCAAYLGRRGDWRAVELLHAPRH